MVQKTIQRTDLVLELLRILLTILTLFSLNPVFSQTTYGKLPRPSQDQIKSRLSQKGLVYVEGNFKKVGSRLNLKESIDCVDANATNKSDCVCLWQQRFEGGIEYQYNECSGSVAETTITFSGYGTREIIEKFGRKTPLPIPFSPPKRVPASQPSCSRYAAKI